MPFVVVVTYLILGVFSYGLAHDRCAAIGDIKAENFCQMGVVTFWPIYWPYRAGLALSHL